MIVKTLRCPYTAMAGVSIQDLTRNLWWDFDPAVTAFVASDQVKTRITPLVRMTDPGYGTLFQFVVDGSTWPDGFYQGYLHDRNASYFGGDATNPPSVDKFDLFVRGGTNLTVETTGGSTSGGSVTVDPAAIAKNIDPMQIGAAIDPRQIAAAITLPVITVPAITVDPAAIAKSIDPKQIAESLIIPPIIVPPFVPDLAWTTQLIDAIVAGVVAKMGSPPPPAPKPVVASASFLKQDAGTQGDWKTAYGLNGHLIANDPNNSPVLGADKAAKVWFGSTPRHTWASTTDDGRAPKNGDDTGRLATAWYSATTFDIHAIVSAKAGDVVTLYLLDWDGWGPRGERIDVLDVSSGTTLDTKNVPQFQNGLYLAWQVQGHVIFRITNMVNSSTTAVVSGVFLGGPMVPGRDPTTDPVPPVIPSGGSIT